MTENSGYSCITNLAVDGEDLVIYRRLGGVSASDRIKIKRSEDTQRVLYNPR